jgi:DNA-binding response OmpR family regulator
MDKILIIEDNDDLRDFISLLLKKNKYEVKVATTRKEITLMLAFFEPQLILADIMLNGEDGRDICKEIKRTNKDFKIVLLSGNPKLLESYIEYGADGVLEKPFTTADVLTKIEKLLSGKNYETI